MRVGQIADIGVRMPDADFWVRRRCSIKMVGSPSKVFTPEAYGIKVIRPDTISPDWLYYMFQYLHGTGYFKERARGSLALVNIHMKDISDIDINASSMPRLSNPWAI